MDTYKYDDIVTHTENSSSEKIGRREGLLVPINMRVSGRFPLKPIQCYDQCYSAANPMP